jgi:hypothetical protein
MKNLVLLFFLAVFVNFYCQSLVNSFLKDLDSEIKRLTSLVLADKSIGVNRFDEQLNMNLYFNENYYTQLEKLSLLEDSLGEQKDLDVSEISLVQDNIANTIKTLVDKDANEISNVFVLRLKCIHLDLAIKKSDRLKKTIASEDSSDDRILESLKKMLFSKHLNSIGGEHLAFCAIEVKDMEEKDVLQLSKVYMKIKNRVSKQYVKTLDDFLNKKGIVINDEEEK